MFKIVFRMLEKISVIKLCVQFDIIVGLQPRQCKSDNSEYFLRVSVFILFIDNFLELKTNIIFNDIHIKTIKIKYI